MKKTLVVFLMLVILVAVFVIGCAPKAQIQDRSNPMIVARENKTSKVESGGQATAGKCEQSTLEDGELWFQSKFGICFAHSNKLKPYELDNKTGRSIELHRSGTDSAEILIVFYKSDDLGLKSKNPAKEYATKIAADFKGVKPIETSCPLGIGYRMTTKAPSDIGKGIIKHFYIKNGKEILWISSSKEYPSDKELKSPFERCIATLTACKKAVEVK